MRPARLRAGTPAWCRAANSQSTLKTGEPEEAGRVSASVEEVVDRALARAFDQWAPTERGGNGNRKFRLRSGARSEYGRYVKPGGGRKGSGPLTWLPR